MRIRHGVGCFLALWCLHPTRAVGQDAARSPELQRLGFYVGLWNETGEMRDDPAKPFKAISGGETCEWAAGGFAVICEEKTTGPGGGWEGVYILGYDSTAKQYYVHGIEKPGSSMHAVGHIEGDRWVWLTDPAPDGSQLRFTFAPADASARTLVLEAGTGDSYAAIAKVTYSLRK
jgi:hypothetical protein